MNFWISLEDHEATEQWASAASIESLETELEWTNHFIQQCRSILDLRDELDDVREDLDHALRIKWTIDKYLQRKRRDNNE